MNDRQFIERMKREYRAWLREQLGDEAYEQMRQQIEAEEAQAIARYEAARRQRTREMRLALTWNAAWCIAGLVNRETFQAAWFDDVVLFMILLSLAVSLTKIVEALWDIRKSNREMKAINQRMRQDHERDR